MRREPEYFEDQELVLVYIAKKLREALKIEEVLTSSGVEYLVEPDRYRGGIIFQSERVGAFFYVVPEGVEGTQRILREHGYPPYRHPS